MSSLNTIVEHITDTEGMMVVVTQDLDGTTNVLFDNDTQNLLGTLKLLQAGINLLIENVISSNEI